MQLVEYRVGEIILHEGDSMHNELDGMVRFAPRNPKSTTSFGCLVCAGVLTLSARVANSTCCGRATRTFRAPASRRSCILTARATTSGSWRC